MDEMNGSNEQMERDTHQGPADETDQTEKLRRELEEERQRMLRLRADFENLRRRGAREQDS